MLYKKFVHRNDKKNICFHIILLHAHVIIYYEVWHLYVTLSKIFSNGENETYHRFRFTFEHSAFNIQKFRICNNSAHEHANALSFSILSFSLFLSLSLSIAAWKWQTKINLFNKCITMAMQVVSIKSENVKSYLSLNTLICLH